MENRKIYRILFVSVLVVAALALTACAAATTAPAATTQATSPAATTQASAAASATAAPAATTAGLKTFTAAELAKYNGQNGNPAYIAVNGKVYDVTNVPQWAGGSHKHGTYIAGKDYTKELQNAPHSASVLDGVPVVGTYTG